MSSVQQSPLRVGVNMTTTMNVRMSYIVSPSDYVIINLNVSSSFGMSRYIKYQYEDDFQGESE